jgi:RNA recognition motif-containing protein
LLSNSLCERQAASRNPEVFSHREGVAAEFSAFVGDLALSVTDADLLSFFQSHYPSAFEAHVVMDVTSGLSKGFGFVRFTNESQRDEAINHMTGLPLHGRSLRVRVAAKRQAGSGGNWERTGYTRGVSQVRCRRFFYSSFVTRRSAVGTYVTDFLLLYRSFSE